MDGGKIAFVVGVKFFDTQTGTLNNI